MDFDVFFRIVDEGVGLKEAVLRAGAVIVAGSETPVDDKQILRGMQPVAECVLGRIGPPWVFEPKEYTARWREMFYPWIEDRSRHGLEPATAEAAGKALRQILEKITDPDEQRLWEDFGRQLAGEQMATGSAEEAEEEPEGQAKEEADAAMLPPRSVYADSDDVIEAEFEIREFMTPPRSMGSDEARPHRPKTRLYPVWFGTNRKPVDSDDSSAGFGTEFDDKVHYGKCEVSIPRSHKIGSVGSSWLKRLLTLTDDRLKLRTIMEFQQARFFADIVGALADFEPGKRQGLVYVHGYNVDFAEAAIRAAQIGFDLKVNGVMAFYSWPSKGLRVAYDADQETIDASEPYLTEFLVQFAEQSGADHIHVIAHSMGNRGLLRAMKAIAQNAERATAKPFSQMFLAAADVDARVFQNLADVYATLARRTTLYASSKDKLLEGSGTLQAFQRVGWLPPVTIVDGIDTVVVSDVDVSLLGHGYYAEHRELLGDIHDLIYNGTPPEQRLGLAEANDDGKKYWKIVR